MNSIFDVKTLRSLPRLSVASGRRWLQVSRVVSPRLLSLLVRRRAPSAKELREVFEQLGVTYIKLGQMIASAPSLFPEEYVKEFENCLDNAPAIPFTTIRRIVEKELNGPIESHYAQFSATPLATASIAQVHTAQLHNGEQVVVKVQKPGVDTILSTDLNILFVGTRLLELLSPHLSKEAISGFVTEIYQYLLDECDFIKEANNLEVFANFLAETNNLDIIVPKPHRQFSTRKVLTMERLYGRNVTDYGQLQQLTDDPSRILTRAMETWFQSITACPFFHADLHSGNLLLLDDGRIGFIDFGMVGVIDEAIWRAAFALFTGLTSNDAKTVAKAMIDIGMTRTDVRPDVLTKDIQSVFDRLYLAGSESLNDAYDVNGSIGDSINDSISNSINNSIEQLVGDIARVARNHGIHFPYAFTLLIKQLLYFDRHIHNIAPDLDLFGEEHLFGNDGISVLR